MLELEELLESPTQFPRVLGGRLLQGLEMIFMSPTNITLNSIDQMI